MTTRPGPMTFFRQSLKSDAYYADEVINIYLLRPLAAGVVWLLYPTRLTPNQLTIIAVLVGCAAAAVYLLDTPSAIVAAGLLVTTKDILDDADGQLARAKQQYSRRGRFLDSIGDFVVDMCLFGSITYVVYREHPDVTTIFLGILGFFGITLRVSYHVFYQASFLHLEDRYKLNRIIEEVTEEDKKGDPVALRLQVIFNLLYTWQDKIMYRIDRWCMGCRGEAKTEDDVRRWYSDKPGLRISGLLGFGTELALLTICSLFNNLYLYLWLNVILMNGIWMFGILYRKLILTSTRTK
ncbi:MAG TPA: CDP-alcohol phosphatidyltransferase family protein [Bacteroidota bacterium]|nr:CDP-alcohol phosphatidyltransferase family protein [Bacteroidota bacterium]